MCLVTVGAASEMLQLWDLTGMSWLSGVSELTHVFAESSWYWIESVEWKTNIVCILETMLPDIHEFWCFV